MWIAHITDPLDALLRPLGFVKRQATWNRRRTTFIEVIDVERSKFGDLVTVNAGVLNVKVHEAFAGTVVPSFVREPICHVRTRIGRLLTGTDKWWPVDDPMTATEITSLVKSRVLPFLDSMRSMQDMEHFLVRQRVTTKRYPPPVIYLALLVNELGDQPRACGLLEDLRLRTGGAWRARIEQVQQRIGCRL